MEDFHLYIVLLLALALSIFNRYFAPKIRNLPPTPLSAFLRVLGYLYFWKQPIHQTLSQIATRHGPILLLHFGVRRVLLISSSAAAEELFTKNDKVFAYRPKLLVGKVFGSNYTNLAWAPHGGLWRHLRRVSCLEMLSFHRQPALHDSLTGEVKMLLRQVFDTKNEIVELRPLFLDLVLDVMMTMFTGKRYPRMITNTQGDESISLIDYVRNSFKMTTDEQDVGYFMPILEKLGLVRGMEKRCNELQKNGDLLMDKEIKEIKTRMNNYSDGSDKKDAKVIELLLRKQKDDPKLYPDELIRGLVQVLMSAGTDTSAGILEWAFSLLLNHQDVLQKAQNEIAKHVGNDRFLEQSDIEHLPYLTCIVKETMRMYPVAPLLVPHESSKGCTIGGYNVPKGTMLMVNVWAIHNDPNIWAEPTKFKPERFENLVGERGGFKLMPFGYGRRSCPGKHLAVRVITLALGSLLHCFDWEKVNGENVDMKEKLGLSLFKKHPLKAVCRPRSTMVNLLAQI